VVSSHADIDDLTLFVVSQRKKAALIVISVMAFFNTLVLIEKM